MDIRQWLDNTADRAPPDQPVVEGIADFLQPRQEPTAKDFLRPRYRRKKRRPSSDSSFIIPRHLADARQQSTEPHGHAASADHRAAHSITRSRTSQSSRNRELAPPSRTYERRPRHKTKTDRYQSKPKKHRQGREERAEGKLSKRRKSHRNDDGERTTGLVQSFQLKNGPKNNRLTVSRLVTTEARNLQLTSLPVEAWYERWAFQTRTHIRPNQRSWHRA